MTFAFAAKRLEFLESQEVLSVRLPTTSRALIVREFEILMRLTHTICTKLQPTICPRREVFQNDNREQTLRLDMNQLTLIREPTAY